MMRGTPTLRRGGWMALALCMASAGAWSTTSQPRMPPSADVARQVQDLRNAALRLDGLRSQASELRAQAEDATQNGARAMAAWNSYRKSQDSTLAALQRAKDCLPGLEQGLAGIESDLGETAQAMKDSHQAVQALAQASAGQMATAAAQSNLAFARRTAREKAFADAQSRLQKLGAGCASRVRSAQWDLNSEQARARQVVEAARELTRQHQGLLTDGQATLAQFTSAARQLPPGIALGPIPAWVASPSGQVEALGRTLDALGWPERSNSRLLSVGGALTPNRLNLAYLYTELARLEDAAAYIDLNSALPATDCTGSDCVDFSAERRDLALRTIDVRQRLERATADWQQSAPALARQLPPIASTREGTASAVAPVGNLLPDAAKEADAAIQALASIAGQLHTQADTAFAQALDQWQTAHLAAYGQQPDPLLPPLPLPQAFIRGDMNSSAAAAAFGGDIRSHAYNLFRELDGEIEGFGAYTYVLVRSAADLDKPSVKSRFQRLLSTLQKLPQATLVPRDQARQVNVFCIPVLPYGTRSDRADPVPYSSALGHQVKLRAQNGLLTQQAVHHRLTTSPGPFLMTLPTRLSQASTESAVLLADLSSYPEDAVEDLVTHYMNGLVDDFPRQQKLWKPPVLQRVALFMIYLADGTGQMVTSSLPTAQARPQ